MEASEPTAELQPADPGPTRSLRRAAAAIVALLATAALAAVLLMGGDTTQEVATEGPEDRDLDSTTSPASTTTTSSSTTSTTSATPTTTVPVVVTTSSSSTTTTMSSSTAPSPPTTTTAGPRKPAFMITPSAGPPGTQAEASGAGCTGTEAGIELTMLQPSGDRYNGDGAGAMPDGTWRVPFSFPEDGPRGKWTMKARCKESGEKLVFEYEPQTFTVT